VEKILTRRLQMDLGVASPIIRLVLGEPRNEALELLNLTEIVEQIVDTLMRILIRELRSARAPVLPLKIGFEQRQQSSHTQLLMAPTERKRGACRPRTICGCSQTLYMAFVEGVDRPRSTRRPSIPRQPAKP
jgi:hypothetical protein